MSYLGSRNAKGEKHGFGIMTYSDGCIYRGQYFMDRANGIGEFDWGDGNRYIGEFKNGKQDGYGIYCWPTGGCYEGMWKNDKMNGFGTYRRNDGVMYVGEWKDDHQFNDGIRIHPEKFLHGKSKKMERKREIRERWNEKRECIYSKEIQLYHDFWSILVVKDKFCDVEIYCTVDPYAHLMEKQSIESSTRNPHLESKITYFVQSIDGSKTCVPSPVLLPPALDADLQIQSSMKDFENRLQYLVKALPPSVSTSNIQQYPQMNVQTETNSQQQIVFNPSNYYGSMFAQNLTNRLNLMVDALEKHGTVNTARRQLSIQPPQQQQLLQHQGQTHTIMTPDERSINRVNNTPTSTSSHLLPNTFTTVAITPSSDQERTNFSATATTNQVPYSIPPLPFSPMFTSPSLFSAAPSAYTHNHTSSSASNSQNEEEEEESSRRLRKRKRTK